MNAFTLLPFIGMFLLVPTAALSAMRKGESAVSKNGVSLMREAPVSAISHQDVDNDFENGTIAPWTDSSEDGTQWMIVNSFSWTNGDGRSQMQVVPPPPPPNNGKYYALLKHDLTKTFGVGILSSPNFVAYPGDEVTFSYWLQSAFRHFNNIELFWSAQNQQEELKLLELFPTSIAQSEWLMSTVRIPIVHPTIGKIVLYGFCDPHNGLGYSIAIDDIFLLRDVTPTIISTARHDSTDASTALALTDLTDLHFSTPYMTMTFKSQSISETSKFPLIETTTVDPNTLCYGGTIDFSPCSCYLQGGFGMEIACINVYLTDVRDDFFSRMDRFQTETLFLYPMDGDSIPPYLFDHDGVEYINHFEINCVGPSLFEGSPLAFENNITTAIHSFELVGCNFKNLTFLKGLSDEEYELDELTFGNSPNINETLKTLPDGFVTRVLRMYGSNLLGLDLVPYPQILYLHELRVTDNVMIDDDTIDVLLNWMLQTANKNSLIKFYIYNNGLKRMPSGLGRLGVLTYFRFDNNILESGIVKKGELKFSDYTLVVMLSNCGIHTIEAGAFQGIYVLTNIYLNDNNLTRLESDVYLPILEQMIAYENSQNDNGFIDVDGNPFDCVDDPCHLTWLLRDNRAFLPFIWNAACANGTLFEDIQPDDPMFKDCP